MGTDEQRRRLLQTALLAAGGALTASAAATPAFAAETMGGSGGSGMLPPWKLVYYLVIRIPEGKLGEFSDYWGSQQVPTLEKKGQSLFGGWSSLTGQQNTIAHLWTYRDLAHFQTQNELRGSDAEIKAVSARMPTKIEETLTSAMMTPTPYSPTALPAPQAGGKGVIATHRISTVPPMSPAGGPKEYAAAAADYVHAAAKHGAELVGAYSTYFGWAPAYVLQVWRYPSMDRYWDARKAIMSDPECLKALTAMRNIYPNEMVELNMPLSYSRLR